MFLPGQSGSDSLKNWVFINEVTGRQRGSKVVDAIKSKDSLLYDKKLIADHFNTYFSTLIENLTAQFNDVSSFTRFLRHSKIVIDSVVQPITVCELADIVKKTSPQARLGFTTYLWE